jgi:HAD superfamily hydrolase (TIGR01509 family)
MVMGTELQAVVFDMDGVIIESEMTHYRAICEAMGEKMKVSYQVFLEQCTGGDERFAMGRMAAFSDMSYDEELFQEWSGRKATVYARLISEEVTAMPGAIELVESVAEQLPVGLATGSRRSDVDAALHVLGGGCLEGLFKTIVTSGDVDNPKPHPYTYSKAVEELGVEPSACFAIEDSPNGIASAVGAGLRVIGVAAMHDASKMFRAERVVSTLTSVSLDDLRQWFAELVSAGK